MLHVAYEGTRNTRMGFFNCVDRFYSLFLLCLKTMFTTKTFNFELHKLLGDEVKL